MRDDETCILFVRSREDCSRRTQRELGSFASLLHPLDLAKRKKIFTSEALDVLKNHDWDSTKDYALFNNAGGVNMENLSKHGLVVDAVTGNVVPAKKPKKGFLDDLLL